MGSGGKQAAPSVAHQCRLRATQPTHLQRVDGGRSEVAARQVLPLRLAQQLRRLQTGVERVGGRVGTSGAQRLAVPPADQAAPQHGKHHSTASTHSTGSTSRQAPTAQEAPAGEHQQANRAPA